MFVRRCLLPLSLAFASADSSDLLAQTTAPARVDFPIVLERVSCYAICDTLAIIINREQIFRQQRGQRLGPGRVGVNLSGADTIPADSNRVSAFVGILQRFARSGYPSQLRPGVEPCSNRWITHTPVLSITWRSDSVERTLQADFACDEPAGLVPLLFRSADSVSRRGTQPVAQLPASRPLLVALAPDTLTTSATRIRAFRDDGTVDSSIVLDGVNPAWSPNGQFIAFTSSDSTKQYQVSLRSMDGRVDTLSVRLANPTSQNAISFWPVWSPHSDAFGIVVGDLTARGEEFEFVVLDVEPLRVRRRYSMTGRISVMAGGQLQKMRWSPDGKSVFLPGHQT